MGHSESKSDVSSESKVQTMRMSESNLFVFITLFNVEAISPDIVKKFKEALILFTVPHGKIAENGSLELYGKSFRMYQMEYISLDKTDTIFNFIIRDKLKVQHEKQVSLKRKKEFPESLILSIIRDPTDSFIKVCQLSPGILNAITTWADGMQDKTLILPITEERSNSNYTHATVLVITKSVEPPSNAWDAEPGESSQYEYFYFDPHGTPSRETSLLLKTELEKVLPSLSERTFSVHCPNFQTSSQGGNCVTWRDLFMICVITHPHVLDSPEQVEYLLAASADVNMMIYELYVFFIGMAAVPHYVDQLVEMTDTQEMKLSFQDMLESKLGIENCDAASRQTEEECTNVEHCAFFNQKCWFKAINTRMNVFKHLVSLYQYFASQNLLPESPNIATSYTPVPLMDFNEKDPRREEKGFALGKRKRK